MKAAAPLFVLAVAASCGPPSPEAIARQCAERARDATGPSGGVAIGIGSGGGVSSRIDLGFSADYLSGRDPEEVYRTCLDRRLGSRAPDPLP